MKQNILIALALTMFMVTSCRKDRHVELSNSDYLIFGHYYGMCIGERCVKIFKLEKDKLLGDVKKQYPAAPGFYEGRYVQLTEQEFNKTKDLINYFPIDLLNENDPIIGQPDAGDWGGLYIEYRLNGVRKVWFVDQMKSHVPEKYHEFIDKTNEKIAHL